METLHKVLIALSVLFAVGRPVFIFRPGTTLLGPFAVKDWFKDMAHIWVGVLIGVGWALHLTGRAPYSRFAWWLLLGLTAVELLCATATIMRKKG